MGFGMRFGIVDRCVSGFWIDAFSRSWINAFRDRRSMRFSVTENSFVQSTIPAMQRPKRQRQAYQVFANDLLLFGAYEKAPLSFLVHRFEAGQNAQIICYQLVRFQLARRHVRLSYFFLPYIFLPYMSEIAELEGQGSL
jgi:hypothetical protein